MNKPDIRSILLEIVFERDTYIRQDPSRGSLQQGYILQEAQQRLGWSQSREGQQAILTYWYDLFRNGILSWGYNLSNPNPPFCHVTDHGRNVLKYVSRDPSNPDGYKAFLSSRVNLDPISLSYIEEALRTYNSDCIKASSVMVGAAAERLVLNIQASLLSRMNSIGTKIPNNLKDWRVKRILSAIEVIIKERKKNIPQSLFESFEAYWPAFTHQIRTVRNESGHPVSIQPVTTDRVHASLLIFPELGILAEDLKSWIDQEMNE
jgi:hypothetical protein